MYEGTSCLNVVRNIGGEILGIRATLEVFPECGLKPAQIAEKKDNETFLIIIIFNHDF